MEVSIVNILVLLKVITCHLLCLYVIYTLSVTLLLWHVRFYLYHLWPNKIVLWPYALDISDNLLLIFDMFCFKPLNIIGSCPTRKVYCFVFLLSFYQEIFLVFWDLTKRAILCFIFFLFFHLRFQMIKVANFWRSQQMAACLNAFQNLIFIHC